MARKLEISNLRYAYDTIDAIDNISLHVDEGEFVGVSDLTAVVSPRR